MAVYKLIENGVFTNTIVIDDPVLAPGWTLVLDDGHGAIGDLWDGSVFRKPPAAPPVVPQTVTRRQARSALLIAGKLASVQPAINAITDATQRGLMQIEFDDSQTFDRHRPALLAMAAALGMTSADLDQLFVLAASL